MTEKVSREDFRKQRELEEARKAGTAPPATDEDGKMINPHIPHYISKVPWYVDRKTGAPSLKHQNLAPTQVPSDIKAWYPRGPDALKAMAAEKIKFKKGSCKNCGATTHQAKDCLERPRSLKQQAWKKGVQIAPDEQVVGDLPLDYDGKRDRWNGYDPSEHAKVMEQYEKTDEQRRKLRADQLLEEKLKEAEEKKAKKEKKRRDKEKKRKKKQRKKDKKKSKKRRKQGDGSAAAAAGDDSSDDDDGDDDDSAASSSSSGDDENAGFKEREDGGNMVSLGVDPRTKTTVHNLRIREDTAKYLRNLDVNSAYYDPKTRSMRDNPNPHGNPEEQTYAGDNFVRQSGDYKKFMQVNRYAWEAEQKGLAVNTLSAPSQAELLHKKASEKKSTQLEQRRAKILADYGGAEHLDSMPRELILGQTEQQQEFDAEGNVMGAETDQMPSSRYVEDVHPQNHSSVWGSWWHAGDWGYACCHATVKNSYCIGKKGTDKVSATGQQ